MSPRKVSFGEFLRLTPEQQAHVQIIDLTDTETEALVTILDSKAAERRRLDNSGTLGADASGRD